MNLWKKKWPLLTYQAMGFSRKSLAIRNIEAQMVFLIGSRILVVVDQNDEADGASYHHSDIGTGKDRHFNVLASYHGTMITRQNKSLPIIQDNFGRGDFQIGSFFLVTENGDASEISPLFLMATVRGWGSYQLTIHRHTLIDKEKKQEVVQSFC